MKSKLNYIFLFLIFLFFEAKSQIIVNEYLYKQPVLKDSLLEYYKVCNKAKLLLFNKEFEIAKNNYQLAFTCYKPQANHLEELVMCFIHLNELDSAYKYGKYCIQYFGINPTKTYFDSTYKGYFDLIKFKEEIGFFNSDPNKVRVSTMIEHYRYNDHFFRSQFERFNFNNNNCIQNKNEFAYKVALQYDSIYAIPYVIELIKEYNFPNAYDIGTYSVQSLLFLLRHYNLEKSIYDSALINGKILPEEYASLADYKFNIDWDVLVKEGKFKPKNNYGPNLREINGKMIVGELDDIENVDERRETIGLVPLWQYAKYKNFELSDAYKKVLDKKKIKYQ